MFGSVIWVKEAPAPKRGVSGAWLPKGDDIKTLIEDFRDAVVAMAS